MNQKEFTIVILVAGVIVFLGIVGYFVFTKNLEMVSPTNPISVEYVNNQYGFKFTLPSS